MEYGDGISRMVRVFIGVERKRQSSLEERRPENTLN